MFFTLLGIIGVFLPLLPTTPFLLLAAACFSRASRRFYECLMRTRWLGNYISNYRSRKGIPLKVKAVALTTSWLAIGYMVLRGTNSTIVRIVLCAAAVAMTVHLLSIKTYHG